MKFKIKKSILGILAATTLSAAPISANAAGWGVTDWELLTYLNGTVGGGNGVVELLTALNSSMATSNSIMKNQYKTDASMDRTRLQLERNSDIIAKHIIDPNGCVSPTRASGGGKSTVSSISSGYNNVKNESDLITNKTPGAEKNQVQLVKQEKIGLCTEEDKNLKTYGCSQSGDYANNQGNAAPILFPALKDSEMATTVPMGGLNKEQQEIRNHNLALMVGTETLPPLRSPKQMQTEAGAAYEVKRQQSNIRKTLALGMPLKEGAIENSTVLVKNPDGTTSEKSMTGFLKDGKIGLLDWNGDTSTTGPKKVWEDVFGTEAEGVKFPTKPSEWDYLTYQVYSRYAATGADSLQTQISSMKQEDILKELFRMNAVSLRFQMLSAQYQRDTNTLLSLIAAVLIEKNDSSTQQNYKKDVDIIPVN